MLLLNHYTKNFKKATTTPKNIKVTTQKLALNDLGFTAAGGPPEGGGGTPEGGGGKGTLCHGAGPEGAGAPAALLKALDTGCTGCWVSCCIKVFWFLIMSSNCLRAAGVQKLLNYKIYLKKILDLQPKYWITSSVGLRLEEEDWLAPMITEKVDTTFNQTKLEPDCCQEKTCKKHTQTSQGCNTWNWRISMLTNMKHTTARPPDLLRGGCENT